MSEPSRLRVWWWLRQHDVRHAWPERFLLWFVRRLPREIVYRCTIMAFADAWATAGTKHPDELTFGEVVGPWERKRGPCPFEGTMP